MQSRPLSNKPKNYHVGWPGWVGIRVGFLRESHHIKNPRNIPKVKNPEIEVFIFLSWSPGFWEFWNSPLEIFSGFSIPDPDLWAFGISGILRSLPLALQNKLLTTSWYDEEFRKVWQFHHTETSATRRCFSFFMRWIFRLIFCKIK